MIEVLKLALDALEDRTSLMKWQTARDAVKEAIAELESQESAEWMDEYNACKCPDNEARCFSDRVFRMMQKYATPPQRTWVGLTDEEQYQICNSYYYRDNELVKMIEAKLKEKNT
jgi:hypothetical protein